MGKNIPQELYSWIIKLNWFTSGYPEPTHGEHMTAQPGAGEGQAVLLPWRHRAMTTARQPAWLLAPFVLCCSIIIPSVSGIKNNNNLKKYKDLLQFLSAIVTWGIRPAPAGNVPQRGAGRGEARGEQPASHPSPVPGTHVILSQHKVKAQTSKGTQFCFKFNLSINVLFDFSSLSFSMVRSTTSTEDMIKKLRCKFHITSH